MIIEGANRTVALEYPVLCARCQAEIGAGVPHDLTNVKEIGRTVYLHRHLECPPEKSPAAKQEKPPEPSEPDGLSDGEALAMMGATVLVAGASYLIDRWRQQKARRPT